MAILTGRDGTLTLQDGSATPNSFVVAFAKMDATLPDGHPQPEIKPVYNRGKKDENAHYIAGASKALDPVDISFSCQLDYTANKNDVENALMCGTVNSTAWTSTSPSPAMPNVSADDGGPIKTIDVIIAWSDGSHTYTKTAHDVHFDPSNIKITESEEEITLNATGQVFGAIETTVV
jgi:hypothetical protein